MQRNKDQRCTLIKQKLIRTASFPVRRLAASELLCMFILFTFRVNKKISPGKETSLPFSQLRLEHLDLTLLFLSGYFQSLYSTNYVNGKTDSQFNEKNTFASREGLSTIFLRAVLQKKQEPHSSTSFLLWIKDKQNRQLLTDILVNLGVGDHVHPQKDNTVDYASPIALTSKKVTQKNIIMQCAYLTMLVRKKPCSAFYRSTIRFFHESPQRNVFNSHLPSLLWFAVLVEFERKFQDFDESTTQRFGKHFVSDRIRFVCVRGLCLYTNLKLAAKLVTDD